MIIPPASQLDIWYTSLNEDAYQNKALLLLNAEEVKRAGRFKFEVHRKRFIMARAALRSILSLYLKIKPEELVFLTTAQGKPYLAQFDLEFNLSHSHELALYAIASQMRVGIDIEKIRNDYNDGIAQRFFSTEEYAAFSILAPEQKIPAFYQLWAGKEALVKALGEGLGFPLSSFTIPNDIKTKMISLKNKTLMETWYLENLDISPDYKAAFATNKSLTQLSYWEWTATGAKKWRKDEQRSLP